MVRDYVFQGYQKDNLGSEGLFRFRLHGEFILTVFRNGSACVEVRKCIVFPDFWQKSDGYSSLFKVSGSPIRSPSGHVSLANVGFRL